MGWFTDDAPDHEGYPVGLKLYETPHIGAGHMRIVELDARSGQQTVSMIQAGCDCGWRSERLTLSEPVACIDGFVEAGEHVRDRAQRLWVEHIALVTWRRRIAGHAVGPLTERDRSLLGSRLVSDLEAVEVCRCGHERREHGGSGACTRPTAWGDKLRLNVERAAGALGAPRPVTPPPCHCTAFRFVPTPP